MNKEKLNAEQQVVEGPINQQTNSSWNANNVQEAATENETKRKEVEDNGKKEPTPREKFYSQIRERHPDDNFDDEMSYYKRGIDDYGELNKKNEEFTEFLKKNPRMMAVLSEVHDGLPFSAAVNKYYTPEEWSMKEGDEGWDKYVEAEKYRNDKENEMKASKEIYEKNIENNPKVIEKFAASHSASEEDVAKNLNRIGEILSKAQTGAIPEELLDMAWKYTHYDTDMQSAASAGETNGRNSKIEETYKSMKGDGLPETNGGGVSRKPETTQNALDKIASSASDRNIWSRGGY